MTSGKTAQIAVLQRSNGANIGRIQSRKHLDYGQTQDRVAPIGRDISHGQQHEGTVLQAGMGQNQGVGRQT